MNFWQFFVSNRAEIGAQTLQHLGLTAVSLLIAIAIGVTVGITLTRYQKASDNVIGAVGVLQTIPSIALLGFLLPLLGIGVFPAIVALFLYALLPIVRNTFTGIQEVDGSIREAAQGMGMPDRDILFKVELPLAIPVIFAGIRTAAVTTVGVATLCALIASGGLGVFIFRGIALNNVNMILAGAVPAAGLALLIDFLLGLLEKHVTRLGKPLLVGASILVLFALSWALAPQFFPVSFQAGFTSEFMERSDGYPGLREHYNLNLDAVELDPGLMYEALKEGQVDVISGFSTDGRIKAYNLAVLADDQQYFPPYYAAPIIRIETLERYPQIGTALDRLSGQISDEAMTELNYRVDSLNEPTREVVTDFLQQQGLDTTTSRNGDADIVIGSKNFTEQYLLAEMMAVTIENYTNLDVELKTGLGGTQIAFNALRQGSIDIYPEYTGTGLLTILEADEETQAEVLPDRDRVFDYVQQETRQRYNLEWLAPYGFNNTYALMMRQEDVETFNINSISELQAYLETD